MLETDVAQIRFGYGFGPHVRPATRTQLVSELFAPDNGVVDFPGLPLADALQLGQDFRHVNRAQRRNALGAEEQYETARRALRQAVNAGLQTIVARTVEAQSPLRERLSWFWADHFTVAPQTLLARAIALSFTDDAIRPYLTGPFAEMLKAVIRHPGMLIYLDQYRSVGPASPMGQRTGRGLNENLARELLELHTMGVGSNYTQTDVRAAAELLTGLSFDQGEGFVFRTQTAQPGPNTILGKTYGSDQIARLSDIDAFLEDLALRPETAHHLARKLAVHFVADAPPEALVDDLEASYRESGGNLGEMTRVLAEHPDTAAGSLHKVKTPFEFITSTMVAVGMRGSDVARYATRDLRRMIVVPLASMGQPFMRAPGPDGWQEDSAYWITPQGLATRISWAVAVADCVGQQVGDPRAFLDRTLGEVSSGPLRFAVSAAETQAEGIALVLASAEFNRR